MGAVDMADKRWKSNERTIARRLGGKRVPITGRGRGDVPDADVPDSTPEIKSRKVIPLWLKEARDQAKAASKQGKPPVVIVHEAGTHHDNDLVLMSLKDYEALLGRREGAA